MSLDRYLTRLTWLCLAPLLALGALLVVHDLVTHQRQQSLEMATAARRLVAEIDDGLAARIKGLQMIAQSTSAQTRDPRGLYAEAQAYRKAFGSNVVLADAERHMLFTTLEPFGAALPALPRPQGRSAVDAALASGQPTVGNLFLGPVSRRPMVPIVVPVVRDGEPPLLLIATIEAGEFLAPLVRAGLPSGWSVALMDGSGQLISGEQSPAQAAGLTAASTISPWSLVLGVDPIARYEQILAHAAGLALTVLAAGAAAHFVGRLGNRRLTAEFAPLIAARTGKGPEAGAPPGPAIEEFASALRLMNQFDGQRADAMDALASRKAELRAVITCVGEALAVVDATHHIVLANPAAARALGCTVDQLEGSPVAQWLPESRREAMQSDLQTLVQDPDATIRRGANDGAQALRANGEAFPIELTATRIDLKGGPMRFVLVARDVSEQAATLGRLRESQAILAAALTSAVDAVLISDERGRLTHINEAFARLHRFESIDECKRSIEDAVPLMEKWDAWDANGALLPYEQWLVPRGLRGESSGPADYRLHRRDTGEVWLVSYSFAPIRDAQDRVVGVVMIGRDVTEHRKNQDALQAAHAQTQHLLLSLHHAQEEERKRVARDVHDNLQQKLAAIRLALLENARTHPDGPSTHPRQALANQLVGEAIDATRRIINDLRPLMLDELGLVPALNQMVSQFGERTGIQIDVEVVGDNDHAAVESTPIATSLYRIVQESLNNVHKHAEASFVHVFLDLSAPGRVELRVTDDGRGIDANERARSSSFGVVGMRERVRALGGVLTLEAARGGGTCVGVVVPIVPGAPTALRVPVIG